MPRRQGAGEGGKGQGGESGFQGEKRRRRMRVDLTSITMELPSPKGRDLSRVVTGGCRGLGGGQRPPAVQIHLGVHFQVRPLMRKGSATPQPTVANSFLLSFPSASPLPPIPSPAELLTARSVPPLNHLLACVPAPSGNQPPPLMFPRSFLARPLLPPSCYDAKCGI